MSVERPSKREVSNLFRNHAAAIKTLIQRGKATSADLSEIKDDYAALNGTPGLRGFFGRLRWLFVGR